MWVLGVNCPPAGWHDCAACLVDEDGAVVAFSEEERFSRRRHSLFRGPANAAAFCLATAGIEPSDVDAVAVGWDMQRLLPDHVFDTREFLSGALDWPTRGPAPELVFVPHHRAHARCAFHASPFEDAAVLVVDGSGEHDATSIWRCSSGVDPALERSWPIAASLGHAYTGASRWLGFSLLEAGKTMGLAAFGRSGRLETPALVDLSEDDYRLDTAFAEAPGGATPFQALDRQNRAMGRGWRERFTRIAGARRPSATIDRLHTDAPAVAVAFAAQQMVEASVTWLAAEARALTGQAPLCLAGGVALNCTANGKLPGPLYVPPVPHDAGVALGAAWDVCPPLSCGEVLTPYLGAMPGCLRTDAELRARGLRSEALDVDRVAALLLRGEVGAVAVGRAEIGPRALCHRSILALPRPAAVSARVNAIKHREPWRPFGPVAFADSCEELWEDLGLLSRYMVGATRVTSAGRAVVPAAVHVDGTTRPQTIDRDRDSPIGAILQAVERRGAPPVLLNTSFNDKGQPIVNDVRNALDAFVAMDLAFLVLDDRIVVKH
jgi:carbamoyltransferase